VGLETTRFRITPGKRSHLADRDPADTSAFADRDDAEAKLDEHAKAIDAVQERLYAEGERALLVVLQGTDTSGKDGTIRHAFANTSPLGISVTAFGKPNQRELAHDFLWRVHRSCPRRGTIGLFNRSHYEDVLVARVEELASHWEIENRYRQINDFERMLTENGTTIIKLMLHISKAEQRERLQARLDKPHKRWKFDHSDIDARDRWDAYLAAYETMLDRCSTEWAPWYVIPSDHKWARNALAAAIIRETLEKMDPQPHQPDWDPADITIR